MYLATEQCFGPSWRLFALVSKRFLIKKLLTQAVPLLPALTLKYQALQHRVLIFFNYSSGELDAPKCGIRMCRIFAQLCVAQRCEKSWSLLRWSCRLASFCIWGKLRAVTELTTEDGWDSSGLVHMNKKFENKIRLLTNNWGWIKILK